MKKSELKIVMGILIIAVIILSVFYIKRPEDVSTDKYLSIQQDGVEIDRIPYDRLDKNFKKVVKGEDGENTIEMTEEGVRITHADCPDKICVHMPAISEPGEMIVCLPNKLLLEIVEDTSEGIDVINQ